MVRKKGIEMKKAISVLLAITMILTVIQAGVFTVSANQFGDFEYSLTGPGGSQAFLIRYTGTAGNLIIPDYFDGLEVVAIASGAFDNCFLLHSVTIPRFVWSLDARAFSNCFFLTEVLVNPNNVNFSSNGGVLMNYQQTRLVYYPGGLFQGYTVPESVTSIMDFAFQGCFNLPQINFNAALIAIGEYAFDGCSGLHSVTIPANVNSIASTAFLGCSNMSAIYVNQDNMTYASANGVMFDYSMQQLLKYPCGKSGEYTVPPEVTGIRNFAFIHSGVTSISLPDSLVFIGAEAFHACQGLNSIIIPAGVSDIGDSAFIDCTNLYGALFKGNAPGIFGDDVFDNCAPGFTVYYLSGNTGFSNPWHGYSALPFEPSFSAVPVTPTNGNVTVTIIYPAIATTMEYKIGAGAWTGYSAPIVMTDNGTVYARCSDASGNNSPERSFAVTNIDKVSPATPTLEADQTQPTEDPIIITISYPEDAVLCEYSIGDEPWEKYTLPFKLDHNDTIYARCFDAAGNSSDTGSIVINYIGFYDYVYTVFQGEAIITAYHGAGGDVVIPDTLGTFPVAAIDEGAFRECLSLTSVSIPDSVVSIGADAFYRCEALTSVTLPAGLLKIYGSAFAGCIALSSITFPAGVADISDAAFYHCDTLEWAFFAGTAPVMGTEVFEHCADNFIVYYLDKHGFDDPDPWYYRIAPFEPQLYAAPLTQTNGNVTVTIEYPAPATVKEYRVNAGAWTDYIAPLILTENATVYARCSDEFGNTSKVVELLVTNIDKIPPATPAISATPEYETTGYVTVTVTFPADAAVRQYALDSDDGGTWQAYTGPVILTQNDIVYARCFDTVGNESDAASFKVKNIITITEGIIEQHHSTTVINRKANLIYGLAPGLTVEEFELYYIETVGEVKVVYSPETQTIGTGTRVDIYNGFEELIASYYIIIFGDINGDGSRDSLDAGTAVDYENYMLAWDPPFDEIMPFAGDINGDGSIDSLDAGIMVDAENYMLNISQVTGRVI